ncbi:MAG: glycine cleavage system protein T [Deltaproteobacteria bacterium]|nr:glycine cleavage system protein T [Deltaproteobacteria bacterium]|tara:strand:- start:156 stop:1247 length:1092 start_codon:yes stop_codon:yes gene_type:complete
MSLRRTPFFECHQAASGRLIDFGGWELPVQYTGIIEEHKQVRSSVGLFDVSHMGEVFLRGPSALKAVRHLVTNNVDIPNGHAQYTAMCNHEGGIVDDLIVYRLADDEVLICVNAANRDKDYNWIKDNNPCDDVEVVNESDDWAQIAIQGRNAATILDTLTDQDLSAVASFGVVRGTVAGVEGCIMARTGYTGEDGFEVFIPAENAAAVWPAILDAGASFGIQPIGLGARDTLRLEAKLMLYGNDINDDTSPLEAGLGWVTKFDKEDFIGKSALEAQKEAGLTRRLVCLVVEKRIARPHCPIMVDGEVVGEVTSGTKAPTVEANIALGYVPRRFARPGNRVQIDIRGRIAEAEVVKPPFYKRPY